MSTVFTKIVTTIGELFNKYKDDDVVTAKEYNANYSTIQAVVNNNAAATKELQEAVDDLTEGSIPDNSIGNEKLKTACVSYNNLDNALMTSVLMHKNNINSVLNPFAEALYKYTDVIGGLYNSYIYRNFNPATNTQDINYNPFETASNVTVNNVKVRSVLSMGGTTYKYPAGLDIIVTNNKVFFKKKDSVLNLSFKRVLDFDITYTLVCTINKSITKIDFSGFINDYDTKNYSKEISATLRFENGSSAIINESTGYMYSTEVAKPLTTIELHYRCYNGVLDTWDAEYVEVPVPNMIIREATNTSAIAIGPFSLNNIKNKLKVIYKLKKNEGASSELNKTPGTIFYITTQYNEETSIWESKTYEFTDYIYEALPDEDGNKVCYYTARLTLPTGINFANTLTLNYTNDNLVTLLNCIVSAEDGDVIYSTANDSSNTGAVVYPDYLVEVVVED